MHDGPLRPRFRDGDRGSCMEIAAIIERSRPDPDMALIETVIASDMNDHAKMRIIERILR